MKHGFAHHFFTATAQAPVYPQRIPALLLAVLALALWFTQTLFVFAEDNPAQAEPNKQPAVKSSTDPASSQTSSANSDPAAQGTTQAQATVKQSSLTYAPPAPQPHTIIRSIKIVVKEIFEDTGKYELYHGVNEFKASTAEFVVRRELFFNEGEEYDQFKIDESLRNLRNQRFLREVTLETKFDGQYVDITIIAQDTWTLIPQLGFSKGDGRDRLAVGIVDSNFLGLGKRTELMYREDNNRKSLEGVYDDPRFMGENLALLAAVFDRNDGARYVGSIGRPIRTLLDRSSWKTGGEYADVVGLLWANGSEDYIFRRKDSRINLEYALAEGDPKFTREWYTFGYFYDRSEFEQADLEDYNDLDLDPEEVSNDPARLADNRRFTGPSLKYEKVVPNFVSMNYIDRFERYEDYNLGPTSSLTTQFAPEMAGSLENAAILSINRSDGIKFDATSFIRGEIGGSSRFTSDGAENYLGRAELKYYRVLDTTPYPLLNFGTHTLAAGLHLEIGGDFDGDRQLLLGADTGLRGYEARSFAGDKRFILNLEDRVHIANDVFQLFNIGAAVFADIGGAADGSVNDLFGYNTYTNVGAGLRLGFPRASGSRILRIDVALPLRDSPEEDRFSPRVMVTGGQAFGSNLRSEAIGAQQATVEVGFDR